MAGIPTGKPVGGANLYDMRLGAILFEPVVRGHMPNIHFILPNGSTSTIEAATGWSLMEVARNAGLPGIVAECGGSALCSTCHVYVEPDWQTIVGPPADLELMTLDLAPDTTEASRLSCQIIIKPEFEGLTVRIPGSQAS